MNCPTTESCQNNETMYQRSINNGAARRNAETSTWVGSIYNTYLGFSNVSFILTAYATGNYFALGTGIAHALPSVVSLTGSSILTEGSINLSRTVSYLNGENNLLTSLIQSGTSLIADGVSQYVEDDELREVANIATRIAVNTGIQNVHNRYTECNNNCEKSTVSSNKRKAGELSVERLKKRTRMDDTHLQDRVQRVNRNDFNLFKG